MPPSLSQLRNFIALAEAGSFTAAAKLAHRSQAAFSRSIAELEKGMGAVLVDRIGHKNELTPLGHVVLEHARHIAADADALERAVRVRTHAGADLFRVGMSSTPLALLAQPLLSLGAAGRGARVFVTGGPIPLLTRALQSAGWTLWWWIQWPCRRAPTLSSNRWAGCLRVFFAEKGIPWQAERGCASTNSWPIRSPARLQRQLLYGMVERFGPDAHPDRAVTLCCEEIAHLLNVVVRSDAIYLGVLLGATLVQRQGVPGCRSIPRASTRLWARTTGGPHRAADASCTQAIGQ